MENTIPFQITYEQAKKICSHCYKDIDKLEDYEICELLDNILDNLI